MIQHIRILEYKDEDILWNKSQISKCHDLFLKRERFREEKPS